jgi:hypothetical protein
MRNVKFGDAVLKTKAAVNPVRPGVELLSPIGSKR